MAKKRKRKTEIEEEIIYIAKVRWDVLRGRDEYKNDFRKLIKKNQIYKGNPLVFEEFPILRNETFYGFRERVTMTLLIRGRYFFISETASSKNFQKRWGINPPVDPQIKNPNPLSLESLAADIASIKILGNYSFPLVDVVEHEKYNKSFSEYSKKNFNDLVNSYSLSLLSKIN